MLTKTKFFALLAIFSFCLAPSASATSLVLHPSAFGGISGSVPFSGSNPDLFGTLDYAVFTTADFTASYGSVFDAPSSIGAHAADGPLVYAYQVNNLGNDEVSFEIVGNSALGSDVAWADGDGSRAPSSAFFDLGLNANWSFVSNNILTGESSEILVFSSAFLPVVTGTSITVDGGTTAVAFGIAIPGSTQIPEPSTLVLVAGLVGLCGFRRR